MYKKLLSHEDTPIYILLIICLVIGLATVGDYGESWDEAEFIRYADYCIQAYQYILRPHELPPISRVLNYYGPAYLMLATAVSGFISDIAPSLSNITVRHFVYFSTSLACHLVLYFLSKRWMSKWAAFGTTLLFASQPLIWGHSFINSKDTPFMAFFLTDIYMGIRMMGATPNARWRWVVSAGILLGLTISIRVIGPLAGLIVFSYGLLKYPRRIVTTLPYYFLIAGVTTYLTWPFLWKAPITAFFESVKIMSYLPYSDPVLFMGNLYAANQLPRRFFPTLLSLQLTEPALFLIAIGFVVSLWLFIKGKNRELILIFTGWFLAPTLWIVLTRSVLLDNARHLLFLWPPLFIMAGMGIDWLMTILKRPVLRTALLLVMALPGINAGIHLHPYEYIYYNSLTGGVRGAYRNFELDYWATSFKESMEYLNEQAGPGTKIMVIGPRHIARQYARPDLQIVGPGKVAKSESEYYYILSLTRSNQDLLHCRHTEIEFEVERDGGILSSIRKIEPGQNCK